MKKYYRMTCCHMTKLDTKLCNKYKVNMKLGYDPHQRYAYLTEAH